MNNYINDFCGLLFPPQCLGCANILMKNEQYLCLYCEEKLSLNKLNDALSEILRNRLMGKVNVKYGFVGLKFEKSGVVQKFIYEIKYGNQRDAAYWFGLILGSMINIADKELCTLVPVPLHKKKLIQRGYNQSEYFGKGLSNAMNIKLDSHALIRVEKRSSQTNKKRFQRWQNAENVYMVSKLENIVGKHIILIDDVITTGATIESCAQPLLDAGALEISVISMAIAL